MEVGLSYVECCEIGPIGMSEDVDGLGKPSHGGERTAWKAVLRVKIEAERTGFEPAEGCYPFADLANRCFRPLSHLSGH